MNLSLCQLCFFSEPALKEKITSTKIMTITIYHTTVEYTKENISSHSEPGKNPGGRIYGEANTPSKSVQVQERYCSSPH